MNIYTSDGCILWENEKNYEHTKKNERGKRGNLISGSVKSKKKSERVKEFKIKKQ